MTETKRILLVDDDPLVLGSIKAILENAGFDVTCAEDGEAAVRALDRARPDLLFCDVNLPGISGMEVAERAIAQDPRLPVIMITAYGSIDTAVQAMKLGARDYLPKPIDDFDLIRKIRRALNENALHRENEELRRELDGGGRGTELIASHPAMQRVLTTVDAVAATRATVLIHGESGTGKTLLARSIHRLSDRAKAPFVEVSCGSLPDPLLESELFGHERGAFTGAEKSRPGKFEVADGGTLFLDEVANATAALQVKLLRVLQDRVFERLGANEVRTTDVRLVLATNSDLETHVRDGTFREDLFYRINVVTIHLPALRERDSDIPTLARHFMRRFAADYGKPITGISPEVLSFFESYHWPGNVRELENVVEHAIVLAKAGTIELAHLPARYMGPAAGPGVAPRNGDTSIMPLKEAMQVPEREYIRRVLRMNAGNRQRTADMLKVNRTTLFNKMKKYGLFTESM